jgi:glutamine amidotransferase
MLCESHVWIVVCDTGLGNLRSVERATLAARGRRDVRVTVSSDPNAVRRADKVIVPGQGAFGDCARALAGGLGDAIRERIAAGAPYLGICLGLQVLFGSSEEAPGCAGLGVLDGDVVRLRGGTDALTGAPLKVPHVGWNTVEPEAGPSGGLLPAAPAHFYFVHSYVVAPRAPAGARLVAGTTEYGERFVSAVSRDNVFACQFHPEKSQREGMALLERFVAS